MHTLKCMCTHVLFWLTAMAMVHGSWLILFRWNTRYRFGFGQTGSTLVLVSCMQPCGGGWMNLNVSLLGVWCTMNDTIVIAHSSVTIQTHCNDNRTRPWDNFDVDWIYWTVSCYERIASTFVLMHVCTWMCHYLVYDAPWLHHNYTHVC